MVPKRKSKPKSKKNQVEDEDRSEDEQVEDNESPPAAKKAKATPPSSKKSLASAKKAKKNEARDDASDEDVKSEETPKKRGRPSKGKGKATKDKSSTLKKKVVAKNSSESESEEEDETDYEVERILDVAHTKHGDEFLVKWRGWGIKDATWEPEKNLNCSDILESFKRKLDKLLDVSDKELRPMRKQIQPYMDTVRNAGVRSSRRSKNKARVTYHGQDE